MLRSGSAILNGSGVKDSTIPSISRFYRGCVVYFGWCPVTVALVGTLGVVEPKVVTKTDSGIPAILICFQIHFLILY